MIEFAAERIRSGVLSSLSWATRTAGLTEMLQVGANKFPGAKPQFGTDCEPGDYLNMSPDGREAAIAFVDSPGDVKVDRHTSNFDQVSATLRVVVWYDESKMRYEGPLDKSTRMAHEVVKLARVCDLSGGAVYGSRLRFEALITDPGAIWGAYGFKADDMLFMLPYRTFAVVFKLRAFVSVGCNDYSVQVQDVC